MLRVALVDQVSAVVTAHMAAISIGGGISPLDAGEKARLLPVNEAMANDVLRVLAIAIGVFGVA